MTENYFPHDADYEHHEEVHLEAISAVLKQNFQRRGAVSIEVRAFCWKDDRQHRRVRLTHTTFETVELTLKQVDLILNHLHNPSTTEAVFVMAQSIADGLDIDLVYDLATGRLKVPHAVRKAVAA